MNIPNPKAEARRPKQIRISNTEFRKDGLLKRSESAPISVFDLLSDFGPRPSDFRQGFMLTEALVYIGVLFVLLGIAYLAMYRCIDNSVALRRSADDIVGALHTGERWRADIRLASGGVRWDNSNEPLLRLDCGTNRIEYRIASGSLYRRNDNEPWSRLLDRVESSSMERESRPNVTVWRWELQLRSQTRGSFKPGRVRPLFTFLAVPPSSAP